MGLLDQVGNILKQYQTGAPPASTEVATHFDQVATAVPPNALADGVAHAMRSDQTPAFGQMVSSLFSQANPSQKAGMLNQLLAAVGPQAAAIMGGTSVGASGVATPDQAQQVSPEAVKQLADHAQKTDGSVIDKLSGFYSQHPTLVKGLGAGALALIMSRISQHQQAGR
jgi:hypothetical protein